MARSAPAAAARSVTRSVLDGSSRKVVIRAARLRLGWAPSFRQPGCPNYRGFRAILGGPGYSSADEALAAAARFVGAAAPAPVAAAVPPAPLAG